MILLSVIFNVILVQALPQAGQLGEVVLVSSDREHRSKQMCHAQDNTSIDTFKKNLQYRNDESSLIQVKQIQIGTSISTVAKDIAPFAPVEPESNVVLLHQLQSFLQWQHQSEAFAEYLQNRDRYLAWIALEKEVTLAERGVAPPASLMLTQIWDELLPGEQYIFGLVGIEKEKWDSAVNLCRKKPGISFCEAIELNWRQFSTFQIQLLLNIRIDEQVWSQIDPENLKIHHKLWDNMSAFERQTVGLLGINGDQYPDQWNLRSHPIWYHRYIDLDPDQQKYLRSIRFMRQHWRPYHRVLPPEDDLEDELLDVWASIMHKLRRVKRFFCHCILLIWLVGQLAWTLLLVWKLKLPQELWNSFSQYIILGSVIALVVLLIFQALKPIFVWIDEHVVAEVRVVVSHVKDVWAMISKHLPKNIVAAVNEGCTGCGHALHCHCFSAATHWDKAGKQCCACCGCPSRGPGRDRKETLCMPRTRRGTAQRAAPRAPAAASTTRELPDVPVSALVSAEETQSAA